MNCPACPSVNLVMSDRQGIEIDYCPQCRGVWLDRGELDKIIERSAATAAPPTPPQQTQQPPPREYRQQYDDHYRDPRHSSGDYYKHKKKKGFLSDIFDFD